MKRLGLVILMSVTLGLISCDGGGGGGGICIAHYSASAGGDQCYDCWDQDTCEEWDNREWISSQSSCEAAGYTTYIGNGCGYTM